MKLTALLIMGLAVCTAQAAEPGAAAAPPAAAVPGESAAGADATGLTREALEQAFDGAMTCSALAAVKAEQAGAAEAWRWGNRSFAFGMIAARFYTEGTKQPISHETMDKMLTDYGNALASMPPIELAPYETGCARKYPEVDKLCEINSCPQRAPAEPSVTIPRAPAPAGT